MRLFTIVPQQSKFIVERLGKYHKTLESGFHWMIPFFDQIEYKMSMKEQIIDVSNQRAITKDNVALSLDGVVFFKIEDEQRAAYNIENYEEGMLADSPSSQTDCYDFDEVGTRQDQSQQRLPNKKGTQHQNSRDTVGID